MLSAFSMYCSFSDLKWKRSALQRSSPRSLPRVVIPQPRCRGDGAEESPARLINPITGRNGVCPFQGNGHGTVEVWLGGNWEAERSGTMDGPEIAELVADALVLVAYLILLLTRIRVIG